MKSLLLIATLLVFTLGCEKAKPIVEAHAAQHKEDIFSGNAIRFYGLKAVSRGLAA